MENREQEYEIDLAKLGRILWQKKKQVAALCVVGSILGFAYPMTRPASYSSSTVMQVHKGVNVANLSDGFNTSDDAPTNILGIVEQLRSPSVIDVAVNSMGLETVQDKAVLANTLSSGLKVENIRSTDLVRITAQGRTPAEAKQFAQGMADGFIHVHNRNKQETQKRKADFLAKQVEDAKKAVVIADEQLAKVPKDETNQDYRQLQRDARIKEEIYASLVKEQESSKIREQFDSEEIQVVSPANLPTTESGPRSKKKMYAAVGFIIGALLSLGYGLLCYRKEN